DIVTLGSAQGGGFAIGRVSDVRKHSSLVTLVFAPKASEEALVHGVSLNVGGQGGGNGRADAPRAAVIAVGDPVLSPSLGGRAIGIVGALESDPARAF